MYYPNERPDFRVFDTLEGSVLWSGVDRTAALRNFESAVEAYIKQDLKSYLILQGLNEKGLYKTLKGRII